MVCLHSVCFKWVSWANTTVRVRTTLDGTTTPSVRVMPLLRESALDELREDERDFVPGVWWHSEWRHGPGVTRLDGSDRLLEWRDLVFAHRHSLTKVIECLAHCERQQSHLQSSSKTVYAFLMITVMVRSVCPSITLVDCDYTYWDSRKVISRINRVILSLLRDPNNEGKFEG